MNARTGRAGAAVVLLLPVLLPGCFTGPTLLLDAGLYLPALEGDVALANTTLAGGDDIDLTSELDLDDTDATILPRAELDFGPLDLTAWGFTTQSSGSGTATADFGGISAGSDVTSDLDLTLAQARVLFDLVDVGGFELGVGAAAQWVDLDLEVEEIVFGLVESVEVQQAVPLLAARAGFDLEPLTTLPLAVELGVSGLALDVGDLRGTYLDLEALVRAHWSFFGLFAGWRRLQVEFEGESSGQEFDGDVVLEGMVIGATLRF